MGIEDKKTPWREWEEGMKIFENILRIDWRNSS
jgi:hypothetical protein